MSHMMITEDAAVCHRPRKSLISIFSQQEPSSIRQMHVSLCSSYSPSIAGVPGMTFVDVELT